MAGPGLKRVAGCFGPISQTRSASASALPSGGQGGRRGDVVFKLKAGEPAGAIAKADAVVVAKVKERQDPKPGEFDSTKASLSTELKQQRQNQFFAAYMTKAREKMKITYSDDAFRRVLGIK